jgi:hypothetical protein
VFSIKPYPSIIHRLAQKAAQAGESRRLDFLFIALRALASDE